MVVLHQPIQPPMDVIRFQQPVSHQIAAAGPMAPRVWHQDTETAAQEQICIAGRADAVIPKTVQQNHHVSVPVAGNNTPGSKSDCVF